MNDHSTESPQGQNRTLINRTLVRIKVLQAAFAYFQSEAPQGEDAADNKKRKRLTLPYIDSLLEKSYNDTYNLYLLLLDFVYEMTRYAETRIEEAQERAKIMHTEIAPSRKFINNRFAQQLFENHTLQNELEIRKLSWDAAHESLNILYKQITESPIYTEYMSSEDDSYASDKAVWRKIFTSVLTNNDELENALEELEIALDGRDWTVEVDLIISYIEKTIKRFKEESGADQPLLEPFQSDKESNNDFGDTLNEHDFGKRLLHNVLTRSDEYEEIIASCLKNWDKERVSYMDMVILKVALAEITSFPEIQLQVSMNEYIDIAREYSSENSPMFINGILDMAVANLKADNKLLKAVK